MALRDIFKRKRKPEAEKEGVEKPKKEVREEKKEKPEAPKTPKAKKAKKARKKTPEGVDVYRIIKAPHITEKATALAEQNQYVFKVFPRSNKSEIKKAIEQLYNVEVLSVKIITVPKKQRRLGRTVGWRKGYKKAIIKIAKEQKIEVMPK